MRDQRSPTPAEDDDRIDSAVLAMLIHDESQRPWAIDEVTREIGDPLAVTDSLARLYGAGLIHRLDGFVFATRPALAAAQLDCG